MIKKLLMIFKLLRFSSWTLFTKMFYNTNDFYKDLFLRLHNFNPIIVKILQCSANNHEIWSDETRNILATYTDSVPYTKDDIDYLTINHLINNKKINFNDIDKPINSGTISLVYDGTYQDKKIIIKIKEKNIDKKISENSTELENIIYLFKWIPYLKKLQIEDNYNIYKPLLETQCNFKEEIDNLELYRKNFKSNSQVKFPKVHHNLCSDNSIILEYIDGVKIENINSCDKNEYMNIMSEVMTHSLIVYGFFHCDAHSGNLLFKKENNKNIIYIIDFGICGKYTMNELNNYYDFFSEIGKSNHNNVSKLFLKFFTNCNGERKDYGEVHEKVRDLFHNSFEIKKEFSFMEIYNLYNILKNYNISTNLSWMKTELAIAVVDGCMKELRENDYGLTDAIKDKINKLNELNDLDILN